MKIKISIVDDTGNFYEGEIHLTKDKITKKSINTSTKAGTRKGSTSDKISELISDGYFDTNRTISDIVTELKTYDYHFRSSDLTLPLRTLVRGKLLTKTKDMPSGTKSRHWTYVKV